MEFSCFFYDPTNVCNLISDSSSFSKYSLNICNFSVHILLKASLENFEHHFASMWNECYCGGSFNILWHCLSSNWDENWPFPVLWPSLSFPNFLVYWVQHFHSKIVRIWNSLSGILSPPLALFIVMLSKAHLTSHSDSRWVPTPLWLSGLLYTSSAYPYHLFLISSASVQFSSVQLLSCVRRFATPRIIAHQASLSITNSRS